MRHVITLRAVAAEVVADEPEFVGHAGGERAGPGAPGETVVVVEMPASSVLLMVVRFLCSSKGRLVRIARGVQHL